MKMFNWDDQELANILWGEGREADDHIVPYPEDDEKKDQLDYGEFDKKKLNEEGTTTNVAEKRLKLFSDRDIAEKNDGVSASGTFADPQLDSPSFATSKTDDNAIAKKTELDICPEVSGNQHEDKELGELVGNGWANIGSFDDLDRIFSNDELDGHTSLGRGDDLWLSSKDLMSGVANSSSGAVGSRSWEFGALGNTSSQIELNSEYMHNEHPSEATSFEYTGSIMSNTRHKTTRFEKQQEYTADTSGLTEEKDDWSKSQLKHQKMMDMMTDSVLSEDAYDTWPSSATISNFSASVPCQQQLPHESGPIAYQHFQKTSAPYVFRNFPQQYSATRMLNPTSNEHQSIRRGAEVNQGDVISFNKHAETTARAMKMTPQEKIEKLRRRQQMRAMLAIQKQQQQLSHQASVDHPLGQESLQEDQFLHMEKAELEADECLNNLPGCDPGPPNKKDNLCTFSDMDECSAEDTALFQLQDIIAKLDTKIRLCIKDSLYRLADSATQRHYASGMNAANRSSTSDSEIMNEDISSHHRTAGNADIEAETNHIDRAVAHLLFHRPFKSSVKPAETPVSSSTSNRACAEQKIAGSSLPSVLLSKSSEKTCNPPLPEPTTPLPFVNSCHEDMLKDVSQNEMSLDQPTERKMDEDDD